MDGWIYKPERINEMEKPELKNLASRPSGRQPNCFCHCWRCHRMMRVRHFNKHIKKCKKPVDRFLGQYVN